MADSLRPETVAIIKASIPALVVHGSSITEAMYARLFRDEQIRALFNHANQGESGSQVNALAGAILAYARNIEKLEALLPVVERIAHKHIGYNILPEHYPYVATALLEAIAEVLGDAATTELLDAWGEAYWFLANILQERERELRRSLTNSEGGWNGWRRFVIAEKSRESDVITTFVLVPEDSGPVMRHRPGQYLTVSLQLSPDNAVKRNYSISCAPNSGEYRISVKREARGAGGSRFLHDAAEIGDVIFATPPSGDFFLPDHPVRPVILLSAGVGLTPMVSMIEAIGKSHPDVDAHYVHAALNSSTHAMDQHVRSIARDHGKISVATFYSEPTASDTAGVTHDFNGFINVEWLRQNTRFDDGDFYLCGPKPFLRSLVQDLSKAGVAAERIHFELFGPADEQIAA